jgi:chromosome segregation ATPase
VTPSRYFVARLAQAFGYIRRAQRMSDAASEMHLLREAEAQLGAMIWENVESIEPLSVEYWNLRKLIKERQEVRSKLEKCEGKLSKAHDQRAEILNSTPELNKELLERRLELLAELEQLAQDRDRIVMDAREVRRSYVGLKMKLEVLSTEGDGSPETQKEIDAAKARLVELREKFSTLKQERIRIGHLIDEGDAKVDAVDDKLKGEKQRRRLDASEAFEIIGEGNKELSILRAESGLLDTQMRQLQAEIGRYVSRNTRRDSACAAAAAKYHGLVDVMRALRRSVALNHRLAGTTS